MNRYRALILLAPLGVVFWLETSGRLPPLHLPWRAQVEARANDTTQLTNHPTCAPTQPNGATYTAHPAGGNYGNDAIVTDLWPDGTVDFKPRGPGFVLADGALAMKWPWWSLRPGRLTVEGRRLDAPAPPLRFHSNMTANGEGGFLASYLIFATAGCWEVTGRVDGQSLTFVVLVQKVGDGPTHIDSLKPPN